MISEISIDCVSDHFFRLDMGMLDFSISVEQIDRTFLTNGYDDFSSCRQFFPGSTVICTRRVRPLARIPCGPYPRGNYTVQTSGSN